uniref:Telethonin-like n=1 Tax=Erpetoichthys calabaricus TaxID=27687 RepID=A0A8C4XEJ0_ERPCA
MALSSLKTAGCEVKEHNLGRKEFYHAEWTDLGLETRHQDKTSLFERNTCQRETYDKRHMTYFLIQRSPYLWMKLGFLGQKMTTFKLPYKDVLPVQMFVPRKFIQDTSNSVRGMRSQELKNTMESGTSSSQNEGVTSEMKKRIPEQTQPCQKEFRAASLVSPPNVLLHSEALRI